MIGNSDIKSIECRFVVYCKPSNSGDDLHVVKEIIHTVDGKVTPNVRLIKNYKRKFWITNKGYRTHVQKKEYTEIKNVIEYQTTQANLVRSISDVLKLPPIYGGLRKLCRNPYIYGADILSTAVLKKAYQTKYPDINTFYNVAVYDIETDMLDDTEEIIMATLSYKSKIVTVIKESFVAGHSDVVNRLNILLKKYIGEHVEKRKIEWEILIVPTEAKVVTECLKKAHEWKPDIIAIWNMDFDIPKTLKALERAGIDPKDVFSDPTVPKEYRHFEYYRGNAIKVTASGKEMSKNFYEQWHTVYCPSSFYFIDAMCLYYQIRSQGGKEQSYSLNAILDKHLGIRKLNFTKAEHYVKAEWHQFMQSKFPLEYIIYNVFDCVSMELLDEVTNDCSLTLPMFSGCSDFHNFNSQPKRLADDMHYFCLDNGYVYGTTSDDMVTPEDKLVTSGAGWIN